MSIAATTQTVHARFFYPQPRITQDARLTYVLESLLATMAWFLLRIFSQFPGEPIVPKPPGSITAKYSYLANSAIVRRMWNTHAMDTKEVRNRREPAASGWWPICGGDNASSLSAEDLAAPRWRWGVDSGWNVQLQTRKDVPMAVSLSPTPPYLPEFDFSDSPSPIAMGSRGSYNNSLGLSFEVSLLSRQSDRANNNSDNSDRD